MMHLPHLSFLRSFEAAARHLSFTSAARELKCTQAAVSNHVRSLEDFIGRPLFVRHARSLSLTDVGKAYLPSVRHALHEIDIATSSLISRTHKRSVVVSCPQSLAAHWLPGVLEGFIAAYPDVDVTVHGTVWADVEPNVSDLSITVSHEGDAGAGAVKLVQDRLALVCAPGYRVAGEVLSTPEQLAEARLIHVLSRATYWELAAEYLGVVLDVKRGLRTNVSGLALEMAENGLGCAVLPQWLVARAIADGRLISPLALNVPSPWAYYLALPEKAGRPQVRQLRDWLLAAGEKTGEEAGDGDSAAAGHERLA